MFVWVEIAKKRLLNKVCTDGGLLGITTRNKQSNAVYTRILFIYCLAAAIDVFGAYSVLIDGNVGPRVVDNVLPFDNELKSSLIGSGIYAEGGVYSVFLAKVCLPLLLKILDSSDPLSENDKKLSMLVSDWLRVLFIGIFKLMKEEFGFQGMLTTSNTLFSSYICYLAPAAKLLVKNMILSEHRDATAVHDYAGVKLFSSIISLLNVVLTRDFGSIFDDLLEPTVKACLQVSRYLCLTFSTDISVKSRYVTF